jgi:hypothetical protein
MGTREIVAAFVEAINGGRAERLVPMMDRSGLFIDSLGNRRAARRCWPAGAPISSSFPIIGSTSRG